MYPRPFAYIRAESLDHALAVLAEHGSDATILAGGCSLIPLMKYRLSSPEIVLDIGGLGDELRFVKAAQGVIAIGALTSHADAAVDPVAEQQPLVPHVAARIADVQVRNMGTVVGGVCSLAPISDWIAPLLVLRGSVMARSRAGEREITSDDFVVGPYQSALGEEELAIEVRFPAHSPRSGASHQKLTVRVNDAVANCAAAISVNESGSIVSAGIAFGSVNPAPFRAPAAEEFLVGNRLTDEVIDSASREALDGIQGFEDAGGDAEFRRIAAAGLFRKAVREAYTRATSEVSA